MLQLAEGIGTSKTRKELHFFSTPELVRMVNGPGDARIPDVIVHDEAVYLAEFADLDPGLAHIADVSPSYLQNPAAARRIHDFAPDARIVILLRDPAPKIFSQYTHLWSEGRETLAFHEAFAKSAERRAAGWSTMFDYEAGGRYAEAVERYMTSLRSRPGDGDLLRRDVWPRRGRTTKSSRPFSASALPGDFLPG